MLPTPMKPITIRLLGVVSFSLPKTREGTIQGNPAKAASPVTLCRTNSRRLHLFFSGNMKSNSPTIEGNRNKSKNHIETGILYRERFWKEIIIRIYFIIFLFRGAGLRFACYRGLRPSGWFGESSASNRLPVLPESFNHGRIIAIPTLHRFLPVFQCELARWEGFPLDASRGLW